MWELAGDGRASKRSGCCIQWAEVMHIVIRTYCLWVCVGMYCSPARVKASAGQGRKKERERKCSVAGAECTDLYTSLLKLEKRLVVRMGLCVHWSKEKTMGRGQRQRQTDGDRGIRQRQRFIHGQGENKEVGE